MAQPKAVRAVGQALGRNPLPIIIPCHRVLASNGKLGGFTGGIKMKEKLLKLEGLTAIQ
jgi:O-6-methylguanine DNA methyltransferase